MHSAAVQDRDGGRDLLDVALQTPPGPTRVTPGADVQPGGAETVAPKRPAEDAPLVETTGSSAPSGPSAESVAPEASAPSESAGPGPDATVAIPPRLLLPRLKKIWADGAYAGDLEEYARREHGIDLEIVRRTDDRAPQMWVAPGESPTPRVVGFRLVKRRWVVERTFAWIGRNRRLSKDYEQRTDVSETWIRVSMSRLMLRRLTSCAAPGR